MKPDNRRSFTKQEIKKLKKYWKELDALERDFDMTINALEDAMQKDLKIDDVEFFRVDGEFLGIGNISKTINLIALYELEKE